MIYCKNCGVELEDNTNFCPLCGYPVSYKNNVGLDNLKPDRIKKTTLTDFQKLTYSQKLKIFWKIACMIIFSGILVTITINLVDSHAITWAKYVIAVGLMLFINATIISFLYRKLYLLFFLSFLTSAALIFLIDIYTGNTGLVKKLGLPLLLAAYIIVLSFVLVGKNIKRQGLNLIAYSLIACGLLCICIDGIISIYATKSFNVSWSLIVMVSVILISSLLLYADHRLKKTDLKRFFHI